MDTETASTLCPISHITSGLDEGQEIAYIQTTDGGFFFGGMPMGGDMGGGAVTIAPAGGY